MCPRQEVPQRHELAMVLILYIDDAPSILSTAHRATIDDNRVLRSDDREGYQIIDIRIHGALLLVLLVVVVGVHTQVVEGELFLDALFESLAFLEGKGVGFGDHGNNIDNVRKLLEHDDIDGLETECR